LVKNISVNQIQEKVTAYNIALGSSKGELYFTSSLDTMNHVANKKEANTIKVPVEVLDEVLSNQNTPLLLKIDVEGFETEVMKGATNTLQQTGLRAIIIELNGLGSRYGYDEREIHDVLIKYDFKPFQYNPKERLLTYVDTFGAHNTIYIRDLSFVEQRLKKAPKIKILDQEI
jgi:FkbM family methyltransferase